MYSTDLIKNNKRDAYFSMSHLLGSNNEQPLCTSANRNPMNKDQKNLMDSA